MPRRNIDASDVVPCLTRADLLFLQRTAGLLLEYNVRSALIARQIDRLAAHLDLHIQTLVGYRSVTLFVADGCLHVSVPELRVNVAVSAEILAVIDGVCAGRIGVVEAARRLDGAAQAPPRHRRRLSVMLALAGSALAWLLQADGGAIAVSGVSTGLGLLLRQELAPRSSTRCCARRRRGLRVWRRLQCALARAVDLRDLRNDRARNPVRSTGTGREPGGRQRYARASPSASSPASPPPAVCGRRLRGRGADDA
jgi:hypothetical protein